MLLVALIIALAVVLLWLTPAWFVAMHAERKGYSFLGFLLLGLLVSWITSLIAATILDDRGLTSRCPECAETIRAAANVCKHCGYRLDSEPAAA